jgi:tetratricopeptide (TPR) repeat protein
MTERIFKSLLSIIMIITAALPLKANLKYDNSSLKTKIYFSYNDKTGQDALVKGKILSISTSELINENDMSGAVQDRTKVTVRLIDNEGLHSDNTLYVIDPNNIVVSKLQIKYIFENKTMGSMLVGYGNFKLSNEGYRVVRAITDLKAGDCFIYKSRGDYYYKTGDKGKAITEYKKAIEMDMSNPSPRLALGLIYYRDEVYNFANAELMAAYNHISSLYDNDDRYVLLKTLAEIRAIETYRNYNLNENRIKFRKEGIRFCKEALKLNRKSVEIYFLLGEFYYLKIDNTTDDDKLARDTFLKVLELDHSHAGANLRLSELYMKHNNREKGLYYAKKAAESDPSSQKALEILKAYE